MDTNKSSIFAIFRLKSPKFSAAACLLVFTACLFILLVKMLKCAASKKYPAGGGIGNELLFGASWEDLENPPLLAEGPLLVTVQCSEIGTQHKNNYFGISTIVHETEKATIFYHLQ